MKKILSTLITATLISSCTIPVMASTVAVPDEKLEGNTTINTTTTSNDITVELNGKKLDFEVSPQIINDTTMVPMRTIFENLGY